MRAGYKTHVAESKKEDVKEFAKFMEDYPMVGIVNLQNLPTQQANNMRKQLRKNDVTIKMGKKRLMKLAIEKAKAKKQGLEQLEEYLRGMPALLLTTQNPFSLFKILKKNKSKAPAKAGQVAPNDLVVNAGPTSFAPGPIISELASFGIKTKVEDGKLTIVQDTVIAKEGDLITDKLASMLLRLGIEPMEIGLDLVAIYENGTIFTKKVLDIDEDQFMQDINNAARWALNLSVEAGYPTKDNIELFVCKAFTQTKAIALETNYLCSDTVNDVIAKANNQMLSVKAALGI
ncbi:50S ribosomal protein L10 [Candidatus Woesearchaeota archaeon]|nr:50S ribosomal protein L10 [Candidatus Woesearchaeota archaeon]